MAGDAAALPDIFLPGGRLRLELLTDPAAQALAEAMRLARETHWDSLRSPHIFMGLLAVPDAGIRDWASRLGVELPQLLSQFQEYFHQQDVRPEVLKLHREFFSDNVIRLLRDAQVRSLKNGRRKISSMDVLISLLSAPRSIVAECFERTGMTAERLTQMAVMAEQSGSGN
jgi:ATP-dependent Clp protease ATP-binding subunit ClpA